jgi:hypothetical protein
MNIRIQIRDSPFSEKEQEVLFYITFAYLKSRNTSFLEEDVKLKEAKKTHVTPEYGNETILVAEDSLKLRELE